MLNLLRVLKKRCHKYASRNFSRGGRIEFALEFKLFLEHILSLSYGNEKFFEALVDTSVSLIRSIQLVMQFLVLSYWSIVRAEHPLRRLDGLHKLNVIHQNTLCNMSLLP